MFHTATVYLITLVTSYFVDHILIQSSSNLNGFIESNYKIKTNNAGYLI